MRNFNENQSTYNKELEKAKKEETSLNNSQMSILTQRGRYEAEMETYETVKKRKNNLIINLKKKHNIINDKEDINDILDLIKKENSKSNQELQNFEEISKKKENSINEKINNLKSQLFINERNKKEYESKYELNNTKYKEYNLKLKSNKVTKQEIDDLVAIITEKENKIKEESNVLDKKDYKSQIANKEKELENTKFTFRNICDEISKIHSNSKLQIQYSLSKDKLKEKEEQLNNIKKEYQNQMKEIYNQTYDEIDQIKKINNDNKKALASENSSLKSEIEKVKNQLASSKTRLSISESSYKEKLTELEKSSEKLKQTCGNEDLKEMLKETEKVLMEKQDILANVSSAKIMYSKFITKSKKSHCCPLCIKKFEDNDEEKFVERLEKIIQKIPETIEKAKIKVEEELKKREQLRLLEPLYLKIETIENKELIALKDDINKYKQENEILNEKLTNLNIEFEQLSKKENQFKNFEENCSNYENLLNEYNEIENEVSNLKKEMNKIGTSKSLEELQKDQQLYQNKSDELQKEINKIHKQQSEEVMLIQNHQNELYSYNEKLANLKNNLHEYESIKNSMDRIIEENQKFEKDIKILEKNEIEIEEEIALIENELNQVKQENNQELSKKTAVIKELNESIDQINNINNEIKRYTSKNLKGLLEKSKEELDIITEKLKKCQNTITKITNILSTQKDRLLKIELLKREVEDNIKYRSIQNEINDLNQKNIELNSKIAQHDIDTYNDNYKILNKERDKLLNEKFELNGELKQLENRIRQIEQELKTDYKDIDEVYIKKQLELKTDKMAYDDLDKYSKALDNAIMHYHSIKMEEINRTIQELWVQTYQGTDIDTIEIRGEKEISKTTKVKSYNYRVNTYIYQNKHYIFILYKNNKITIIFIILINYKKVVMLKDGKEINMRGRCSSGQKVLASLIIRLALAESFCINCGILALDEPTTNLDKANIESLAESLTMLIKHRRKQSNFQLVVITHDESFVQQIGKSEFASYYYRISKDLNGHSRIVKHPISTL